MYGETFYGRHTAQHQLQWTQIKKTKVRSFKSSAKQFLRVILYK